MPADGRRGKSECLACREVQEEDGVERGRQ